MRAYDKDILQASGVYSDWVQENHAFTKHALTIRGLHFQLPPYDETKLIRVIQGAIQDVFVDLRANSSTFGKWASVEISKKKNNLLLIPAGFAHGYCTLENNTEVVYKVDKKYNPEYERGILWNDDSLGINWAATNPVISHKDKNQPSFEHFLNTTKSIVT